MANHRLHVILSAGRQEVTNGADQTKQYICAYMYGPDCMFDLSAVSLLYQPSNVKWTLWLWCTTFCMASLYAVTISGTHQLFFVRSNYTYLLYVTISGTQ